MISRCFLVAVLLVIAFTATAEPAKRIIALSPHIVEQLYSIGAGDSIIATTDNADYPEQAKNIPVIGGFYGVQIEKIVQLKPDLIVYWGSGNKASDIRRLKEFGFKLYNNDPKTLAAIPDTLIELGKLTGYEVAAQEKASQFRRQLNQLVIANSQKASIKVFYQLWSSPLMTVAKGSWIQQLLTACHSENVFYHAVNSYPQVSTENVLLKQPQVILQANEKGNVQGIDWSKWPEIPAVKFQQIYQLNADILYRPTLRAIEGAQALCQVLDKSRLNLSIL
ncbi:MAG: cobalamin-binding protein [Parashewanella sp.]